MIPPVDSRGPLMWRQAVDLHVGIVDVGDRRGDHLAQVVRRDVGRHAHGDARGAVDQQVGEGAGRTSGSWREPS